MSQYDRAAWTATFGGALDVKPRRRRARPEFEAAKQIVTWANLHWWGVYLHHSPNEELNQTARQLAAAHGTRKGFPDFVFFLP